MNSACRRDICESETYPFVSFSHLFHRSLTRSEFLHLADVPPELEWFANINNVHTRRAYRRDVQEFIGFAGVREPTELRVVTRAHVIAWRKDLEDRTLAPATIRRKLSALSSLFDYLCDQNAVPDNPVNGVERPGERSVHTPALGDSQSRALLDAPPADTLLGKRDRAILAVLLYHALRREELCKLRLKDLRTEEGVAHLVVRGKGSKVRSVPLHPVAARLIEEYLADAGIPEQREAPIFRPTRTNAIKPLHPNGVFQRIRKYGQQVGLNLDVGSLSPHSLRATAATNALSHDADIATVQEWLGHADISTTRIYDRRKMKPEDSPTFRIRY